MKIRDKKRKTPAQKVEPKKTTETPAVITLPDESNDLLEAASMKVGDAKTVGDVVANNVEAERRAVALLEQIETEPELQTANDTVDAEYEDIPARSNEEIAAEAMIQDSNKKANGREHPGLDPLLNSDPEPIEVTIAEFCINWVRDIGERMKPLKEAISKDLQQAKLRCIAFGNEIWDRTKAIGNKFWAAYDAWKLSPSYIWLDHQRKLVVGWFAARGAEWKKFIDGQETIQRLEGRITALTAELDAVKAQNSMFADNLMKELRANTARLAAVEKALIGQSKSFGKIPRMIEPIDPERLAEFMTAMQEGRKAKAADIWRSITGLSLSEAKLAVSTMGQTVQ